MCTGMSLCVLVMFSASFKNVRLLKFQLSGAEGLNGVGWYVG